MLTELWAIWLKEVDCISSFLIDWLVAEENSIICPLINGLKTLQMILASKMSWFSL